MLRKNTRIILRAAGWITLSVILLLITSWFALQSYAVQTWVAQRASAYLSSELKTIVHVDRVRLDFFRSISVAGLHVRDQHGDTLFDGDLSADVSGFDLRNQRVRLDRVELVGAQVKIKKYTADSVHNFNFLTDYFAGGEDTGSEGGWDVQLGEIRLNGVHFAYTDVRHAGRMTPQMNYSDINVRSVFGSITNVKFSGDSTFFTVNGLMGAEQSGLELSRLDAVAMVSSRMVRCDSMYLKTSRSLIEGAVAFSHDSWNSYTDFLNKVSITATLGDSSRVSFTDIATFTGELNGLNALVGVSGHISGSVADLHGEGITLRYGRDTRFNGNVHMTGLPDFMSTFIHLEAKELSTSYADAVSIPQYPFLSGEKMPLPVMLSNLGRVSYKGKFDGFPTDFTTYGRFSTALGKLGTKLSVRIGEKPGDISYDGRLSAEQFHLGKLLGQNDFNQLEFDGTVKGRGFDINTLDAEMTGAVNSIRINDYTYRNITVNGSFDKKIFNGLLTCADPNANFDFNGSINFTGKVPEMDFISTINHLRLRELNITRNDSGALSSQILINIRGDNINNISGQIHFDNTIYKTRNKVYKLATLNLQADQDSPEKKINLSSAYLNAFAHGNFELTNLKGAFDQFLYSYYPTVFKKPPSARKFSDELQFRIVIRKFNTIRELFLPDVMLSPSTLMEGNFDAAQNKFNLNITSARASYKKITAEDLLFIVNESGNTVLAESSGKALHITDSLTMEHFNFVVRSTDTDSRYIIDWDNLAAPRNNGKIEGALRFSPEGFSIRNEKTAITINDSLWKQSSPAHLYVAKKGSVNLDSLMLRSHHQVISARGKISETPGDSLTIGVHNVVLEQFNPLLRTILLKLEGVANGDVVLSNVEKNFAFSGYLDLEKFRINDNTIGELVVTTKYFTSDQKITLSGFTSLGIQDEFGNQSKNIAFNGFYYPTRTSESIDIEFSAMPANLRLLNPYLDGIMVIRNGFVNGSGRVHGTPSEIKLDGKFRMFNSEITVDYTNVTYIITGDIEIMPDQIRFSDLLLREKGYRGAPTGTVNGNIFHRNFERIQLDYDITYRNMLVMNTTEKDNPTFYGKIYGSGNAGIYGYLNDLHMVVVDTTTRNSKFYLPLDGPAEIGENDFIHFVKKDTVKTKQHKPLTGFSLDMVIHATPDVQAQIILDKQHGDMLTAQGYGDLTMRISTLGKFEMFGEYVITGGDYLFTLENVINKKFEIDPGSSIAWSGNPNNAEIKVAASYKQRASIAPLLGDSTTKGRFPVDCKVLISGKLFSPSINFAIEFPNIEPTARARIANVLSDEAELNRQVASFLLFRTFVPPLIFNAGSGGVTAGGAAASTSSELLSNRVSEFLNAYFGNLTGISDLQLGLNYRPGTQTNSEAVDVALSKQFFNNKVSFDGNFGVNSTQTRNNSGLIGDVNIDYKLSDDGRYRLKGFNRSNDITQITTAGGPYTQGIGFFYREEFETFVQLLKRYQRKSRKPAPNPTPKAAPADSASVGNP